MNFAGLVRLSFELDGPRDSRRKASSYMTGRDSPIK